MTLSTLTFVVLGAFAWSPSPAAGNPFPLVSCAADRPAAPGALESTPAQPRPAAQDRRPMTEPEIQALIRTLEPVLKDGARAIRGLAKPEIEKPRMDVLIGDVLALLSELHARELLGALDDLDLGRGRADFERAVRGVGGCVRRRLTDRVGPAGYTESMRIVTRHRDELESVLLPERPKPSPGRPGGPR